MVSKHNKNALAVLILVLAAVALYFILAQAKFGKSGNSVTPTPQQTGCTQEAKLCPDGTYVGRSGPSCQFAPCPSVSAGTKAPLKTFSDPSTGISFSYPEKLSTKYIDTVDWPPQPEIITEFFACNPAGKETSTAGITEKISVDGHEYCRTKETEGAAGSIYTQYAYAFADNDNTIVLTFTLRFTQCDNFSGPAVAECKSERAAFDIDGIVDKIARSVKF